MNLRLSAILTVFIFALLIPIDFPAFSQDTTPTPQSIGHQSEAAKQAEEAKQSRQELERKALALLDELVAESPMFDLIDNRILVRAKAVELYWNHDETRARALLREVVNEVSALNAALMYEPENGINPHLVRYGHTANIRTQLVNFISTKDGKLALEFLRATRPPQTLGGALGTDHNERYLESLLATRVAGSDPQAAFLIAEESLKTGLNHQVIEIWNNLRRKDPQLGNKLANQIVGKLRSADLLNDVDKLNATYSMLHSLKSQLDESTTAPKDMRTSHASRDLNLTEAREFYRELLELVIGTALKLTPTDMINMQEADKARNLLMQLKSFIPEIEKQLPSQTAAIRAKLTQFDKALHYSPQQKYQEEYQQKMQSKSMKELLDLASTAPQEARETIYHQALNKAIELGDREAAQKIVKENMQNPINGRYLLNHLERQQAERNANDGNFHEARILLAQYWSDEEKAQALARWAMTAIAKKDEHTARQFLDEARGLLGSQIRTRTQIDAQMAIAGGYLNLDPDRSFEIAEAALERLNKVVAAGIEMMIFNGVKEEEVALASGEIPNVYLGNFVPVASELMRQDFDRTVNLLRRWQLSEVRIMVSLTILQGLLGEQSGVSVHHFNYRRPTLMRR
jgi:hypothetical protein